MKQCTYSGVEKVYDTVFVPTDAEHKDHLARLKQQYPHVLMWLWKDDE